jgi:hypothetical protein
MLTTATATAIATASATPAATATTTTTITATASATAAAVTATASATPSATASATATAAATAASTTTLDHSKHTCVYAYIILCSIYAHLSVYFVHAILPSVGDLSFKPLLRQGPPTIATASTIILIQCIDYTLCTDLL